MTPKSSDHLMESLSALVDNEASELEVRRILKNIENDPALLERWRRYHLIGAALRREHSLHVQGVQDLVSGVADRIDREVAVPVAHSESSSEKAASPWWNFIGKTTVAASFAAALVLGFGYMAPSDEAQSGARLADAAPTPAPERAEAVAFVANQAPLGFAVPSLEGRTVGINSGAASANPNAQMAVVRAPDDMTDMATQQLLNQLLILHSERASVNGSLGIMPFARISHMQPDAERSH